MMKQKCSVSLVGRGAGEKNSAQAGKKEEVSKTRRIGKG